VINNLGEGETASSSVNSIVGEFTSILTSTSWAGFKLFVKSVDGFCNFLEACMAEALTCEKELEVSGRLLPKLVGGLNLRCYELFGVPPIPALLIYKACEMLPLEFEPIAASLLSTLEPCFSLIFYSF